MGNLNYPINCNSGFEYELKPLQFTHQTRRRLKIALDQGFGEEEEIERKVFFFFFWRIKAAEFKK
ncbi:hypothetical protein RchiOBHm_Chr6g0251161 [Rosa chinensis]|uniref:Uncharacterized protein n=1 Tax=Rosa chinensis TaxID=74649 RepID=A0A2P6PKR0_ROSCH|nr:hypothetical protein RchiOBHm_Chr6g0251161 [Rosa chinensis]